jgi:hypothetical protein
MSGTPDPASLTGSRSGQTTLNTESEGSLGTSWQTARRPLDMTLPPYGVGLDQGASLARELPGGTSPSRPATRIPTDRQPPPTVPWLVSGWCSLPQAPRAVVGRSEGAVEQGACWTSEWHIRTVGGLEAGEVSPVPPQPETSSVDQPGHAQWRYRAAVGGNAPRPCPADSGACCCATKATPSVRSVAFGRGDDRWHCDGFSMRLLRVGPTPTT